MKVSDYIGTIPRFSFIDIGTVIEIIQVSDKCRASSSIMYYLCSDTRYVSYLKVRLKLKCRRSNTIVYMCVSRETNIVDVCVAEWSSKMYSREVGNP